ncbi:MAG: hypothetical protein D3917_04385 [Candidatus Electrothrix sp. AX5]|nr:hypothetical protein [Candidatus Electrothrix sp. AX5]
MSALVNCIKCGKPVSKSALRCPHCGKERPYRIKCDLCGEFLKSEDTIGELKVAGFSWEYLSAHKNCKKLSEENNRAIEDTKDKRFTCKVCGKEMSWRELKEPQCSLYSCLYCGDLLRQHIYRHIYQYAHTCKVCSVLISSYEPVMDGDDYYHEKCHKIAYPSKYVPPPQQSSVKSEGCFVATLCYSSPDAPEVISLKEFRDKRLKNTWSGRIFVRLYYKCSPYVVSRLRNYPIICQWIRKTILDRIVDWIRKGQEVT